MPKKNAKNFFSNDGGVVEKREEPPRSGNFVLLSDLVLVNPGPDTTDALAPLASRPGLLSSPELSPRLREMVAYELRVHCFAASAANDDSLALCLLPPVPAGALVSRAAKCATQGSDVSEQRQSKRRGERANPSGSPEQKICPEQKFCPEQKICTDRLFNGS